MRNVRYPIIYHPLYDIPLPENHRFPGTKYSALIEELETKGLIENYLRYVPKPTTAEYLSIAHDPLYIQAIETGNLSKQQQTKLGLPWSKTLVQRSFLAPNGTLLAARLALQTGIACHAAGGTHHAHWNFGAGFCVFNDLAYAARALIAMKLAKRVLILGYTFKENCNDIRNTKVKDLFNSLKNKIKKIDIYDHLVIKSQINKKISNTCKVKCFNV